MTTTTIGLTGNVAPDKNAVEKPCLLAEIVRM